MKANYRIVTLCAIIFFLTTGNVLGKDASGFFSGNDLLTRCRNSEKDPAGSIQEAYDTGFCLGIIQGVVDTINSLDLSRIVVCIPAGVTYGQSRRVVINYLQNHPEELHLSHAFLIQKALKKAFPCK